MASRTQILHDELQQNHPTTNLPYSQDDQTAAGQLNAVNRPAATSGDAMRQYWILERKNSMNLIGRLTIVSESSVGSDPLGDTIVLSLGHICSAKAMLAVLLPNGDFNLDLADARFDAILDDLSAQGCKVISPADKAALQSSSVNAQSRASEIGTFTPTKSGNVQNAR